MSTVKKHFPMLSKRRIASIPIDDYIIWQYVDLPTWLQVHAIVHQDEQGSTYVQLIFDHLHESIFRNLESFGRIYQEAVNKELDVFLVFEVVAVVDVDVGETGGSD